MVHLTHLLVVLTCQLLVLTPWSLGQNYCSPYNDDQNGYAVRDCGYLCKGLYYPCCDQRVPVSSTDYDSKYYCWCCQTTCEDLNAQCFNASLYTSMGKNSTESGTEGQDNSRRKVKSKQSQKAE